MEGLSDQPRFYMDDKVERADFVIVGGIAAGPKTAATLARRLPEARITLFQKEEYLSYASCGLSYFASGDLGSLEELMRTPYGVIRDSAFFKESKGFDAITGAEVIDIDREEKIVMVKYVETGDILKYEYGKLVLAIGAVAKDPEFPVVESQKIRPFKKPEDAMAFLNMAQSGQIDKAIILGGGFIGCELAEAAGGLWGIDVTLIERENQVLPGLLDHEMAAIVQRHLSDRGVDVITGAEPDKIDLDEKDCPIVSLKSGKQISADYVFLCFGFRPEVSLAERCGLAIGETGGILVDKHLRTSDPDVYAGGDCVEQFHRITGEKIYMPMGSLANRHGRVIAENLAGKECEFPGVLGTFLLKVFDINVGAAGLTAKLARKAGFEVNSVWGTFPDKPDYYPESKTVTLKLTYDSENDRVYGLQVVGKGEICSYIDVFSCHLQNNSIIDDLLDFDHGYAPPYSEALHPLHHLASMVKAQQRGMNFISPDIDLGVENSETILLDVREQDESKDNPVTEISSESQVRIINIPLNDLNSRIAELNRGHRVIIICQRGSRSYQAAITLRSAGFTDIEILGGGLLAHK